MSKEVAENYVSAAASKDGRDPSIPIVVVQAGREPPMFTCHFLGWDADAAQRFEDPYERRKRLLEEEKQRKREEEEAKVRRGGAGGQLACPFLRPLFAPPWVPSSKMSTR